jgi:protein-S-isoprenylcysteine O-methyltransferase Ste14
VGPSPYNGPMHGERETSRVPRLVWVLLHAAEVGVSLWILLGGGNRTVGGWVGARWPVGDLGRRAVLAAFALVLWGRMTVTALYILKRRFGWGEALPVIFATAVYQWGFALLGAGARGRLDLLDAIGIVLYVAGSTLNTSSELQRRAFKALPANEGRLYTGGWFALTRHPNYFGDTLWGLGWALVTHNPWSAAIVAIEVGGFVFSQIPALDRYLEGHYGEAYRAWARRTKRFIPFVY